jgi:hypothetical protein
MVAEGQRHFKPISAVGQDRRPVGRQTSIDGKHRSKSLAAEQDTNKTMLWLRKPMVSHKLQRLQGFR